MTDAQDKDHHRPVIIINKQTNPSHISKLTLAGGAGGAVCGDNVPDENFCSNMDFNLFFSSFKTTSYTFHLWRLRRLVYEPDSIMSANPIQLCIWDFGVFSPDNVPDTKYVLFFPNTNPFSNCPETNWVS